MKKEFLSYDVVRNNALRLAKRIFEDGFTPDVIYVPLRGGAYLGNVLSEFFKLVGKKGHPVFYAAVVAHSYLGITEKESVRIDGWTYNPEHLRNGDKILFTDDIFDSGKTINHLLASVLDKGIPREDVRIAVHDYKFFSYREPSPIIPDYWCRKHVIDKAQDNCWIHYLSHELEGLTEGEIDEHYLSVNPELSDVFDLIKKYRQEK